MLGGRGIRVVGVYPGPVDTDMAEKIPLEKVSPACGGGRRRLRRVTQDARAQPDRSASGGLTSGCTGHLPRNVLIRLMQVVEGPELFRALGALAPRGEQAGNRCRWHPRANSQNWRSRATTLVEEV